MIMLGAGFGMIIASVIGAIALAARWVGPARDRRAYARRYARHSAALAPWPAADFGELAEQPACDPDAADPALHQHASEAERHDTPHGDDPREDTETFLAVRGWPVRRTS